MPFMDTNQNNSTSLQALEFSREFHQAECESMLYCVMCV